MLIARPVCQGVYSECVWVSDKVVVSVINIWILVCSLWNAHTCTSWEFLVAYSGFFSVTLALLSTSRHVEKPLNILEGNSEYAELWNSNHRACSYILSVCLFASALRRQIAVGTYVSPLNVFFSSNITSGPYFFLNWSRWFKGPGISCTD